MKKFCELGKGDVVWCLWKDYLERGPQKYTITGEWINMNGEKVICATKDNGKRNIKIPKSSFRNSYCSRLYEVLATTEEELLEVSGKFIVKRLEWVDKKLGETRKYITYLESLRSKLDKLLVRT